MILSKCNEKLLIENCMCFKCPQYILILCCIFNWAIFYIFISLQSLVSFILRSYESEGVCLHIFYISNYVLHTNMMIMLNVNVWCQFCLHLHICTQGGLFYLLLRWLPQYWPIFNLKRSSFQDATKITIHEPSTGLSILQFIQLNSLCSINFSGISKILIN